MVPNDRRDLRRRLFQLAASQGGYFSAAQAKSIGYSYQAQGYHVHAGNWARIDRGLFRLIDWVPGDQDDLIRWTLWSRGRAVISYQSALAVHRIGEFEPAKVHLTVPVGFSMSDPAVALHFADLQADEAQARDGFTVTTPVRTLVDVASISPDEDQLTRAIAEAFEMGLLTVRQLRAEAETIDPRAALNLERAIGRLEHQ